MTSEQAVDFLTAVTPCDWTTNGSIITGSDGTIIDFVPENNEWFCVYQDGGEVYTQDSLKDLTNAVAWYVTMFV